MIKENFNISYPAIYSGTDKSEISFISGTPDLESLFFEKENCPEDKKRFFVTDGTVASLDCMESFISKFDDGVFNNNYLIILGSGEKYKTVESVLRIVTSAIQSGLSRNDIFVGIGGGVICDITAFAASIFKRGACVQLVPTTLLAMVDASIGGKTGCDYQDYKNIIGTFFPASKIYYHPEFIQFLPDNQYNSGLAEAFKTALLCDKELYSIFKEQSEKIKARDPELLEEIIKRCVSAKAAIVEQDFTEQNIRANLNLGHTFGHALESVAGLGTITHGYAVAWGIGRSVALSLHKGYCQESFKNEIFNILKMYNWEVSAVPACVVGGGVGDRLAEVMHKDKKNISGKIRIVLQKDICNTFTEEFSDEDILSVLK